MEKYLTQYWPDRRFLALAYQAADGTITTSEAWTCHWHGVDPDQDEIDRMTAKIAELINRDLAIPGTR